jgi:hypothetical protein
VGPGRQAFPQPLAAGQPRPIMAAGRFRPDQPLPRLQNLVTERSDAPSSFPLP